MRGPTQPVCQMGTPCSEPAKGAVLSFLRSGHAATRVRVAFDGSYSVRLAPGRYTVRVVPALRIGSGVAPATVFVQRGRNPRRDFAIDTGIR
jgi:hypothetical protein